MTKRRRGEEESEHDSEDGEAESEYICPDVEDESEDSGSVDVEEEATETEKDDEEDEMDRFECEVKEAVDEFVDEPPMGRKEMPESSDEDEDPMVTKQNRIRRRTDDTIGLGKSFMNASEFKEAVLEYALRTGNNIKQNRWEKTKVEYVCGIKGKCKWRVYCSWDKSRMCWLVKTSYPWHSCIPNARCKLLKAPVIAKLFMDKIRMNPKFMPLDIQQHIKGKWKLVSSGGQYQNGRSTALRMLDKEYAEQYAHIRGYAAEVLSQNPVSTVIVDTIPNVKGEDVFQRFYVCFENIRSCWMTSCRPIIGLDGTFLKVAVKGCLLSAVGHDANNQIYPLAWAVVQSETGPNWLWFIQLIKKQFNMKDGAGFVLISDRSRGLRSSVSAELPEAEHRMCVKHIIENLKNKNNNASKDLLKPLVWRLAWSYNPTEFEENL